MIDFELFRKKIRWAGVMSGYEIDYDAGIILYEELKNEETEDFLNAIKDVAYGGEKLTYFNIHKHLLRHRLSRQREKEREERKKEEAVEILNRQEMPGGVRNFIRKLTKRSEYIKNDKHSDKK